MNIFTRIGSKLDNVATKTVEVSKELKTSFKVGFEVGKSLNDDPIIAARRAELERQAQLRIEQAEIERAAAKHAEHRGELIDRKIKRLEQLRSEALQILEDLAKLGVETP